ncbi:MAG: polyamine ABC transporter ATP-binding protein, partial [Lentisphaerae bacterium]|nr:polyamine ABC transporter ATP-binding protein [Lentisphaerota bacterium]
MSGTAAIRFEGVTKRLGGRTVLDDVSFEVPRGETFVI